MSEQKKLFIDISAIIAFALADRYLINSRLISQNDWSKSLPHRRNGMINTKVLWKFVMMRPTPFTWNSEIVRTMNENADSHASRVKHMHPHVMRAITTIKSNRYFLCHPKSFCVRCFPFLCCCSPFHCYFTAAPSDYHTYIDSPLNCNAANFCEKKIENKFHCGWPRHSVI